MRGRKNSSVATSADRNVRPDGVFLFAKFGGNAYEQHDSFSLRNSRSADHGGREHPVHAETGGILFERNGKLSTSRKSGTRTAMLFLHAPTYRAASPASGCTRNPRAAYRTSMPLSAGWTRTGTSTTTTPYTYAHNGRRK